MPKIINDGVVYTASSDSANNVVFEKAGTNIASETVQGAIKELDNSVGAWLPTKNAVTGDTEVVIESSLITESSIIDIYYSNTEIETSVSQEVGVLTITFSEALVSDCTINVKVVNLV